MIEANTPTPSDEGPNVIFSYTRAQAIEDGVLVDLTKWARELGFRYPVTCTAGVWNGHIVPAEALRSMGQSERGRGHDVLWMLLNAIRQGGGGDCVFFDVIFLQPPERHVTVKLKALCGPGDDGQPAITIMLPDED